MIVEATFKKSYKIPKRSSDEAFGYETPLNNAYCDYQGYTVQRKWQQGATFTQYPTHYPPIQYPTPVSIPVESVTQTIWNTLNNIKETPKTHQRNISKLVKTVL